MYTEKSTIDKDVQNNIENFIENNRSVLNEVAEIYNQFDNQQFQYEKCKRINQYAANVFTLILTANEMERRTLFYYFSRKRIVR